MQQASWSTIDMCQSLKASRVSLTFNLHFIKNYRQHTMIITSLILDSIRHGERSQASGSLQIFKYQDLEKASKHKIYFKSQISKFGKKLVRIGFISNAMIQRKFKAPGSLQISIKVWVKVPNTRSQILFKYEKKNKKKKNFQPLGLFHVSSLKIWGQLTSIKSHPMLLSNSVNYTINKIIVLLLTRKSINCERYEKTKEKNSVIGTTLV